MRVQNNYDMAKEVQFLLFIGIGQECDIALDVCTSNVGQKCRVEKLLNSILLFCCFYIKLYKKKKKKISLQMSHIYSLSKKKSHIYSFICLFIKKRKKYLLSLLF